MGIITVRSGPFNHQQFSQEYRSIAACRASLLKESFPPTIIAIFDVLLIEEAQ
jgi:hypothetical protein